MRAVLLGGCVFGFLVALDGADARQVDEHVRLDALNLTATVTFDMVHDAAETRELRRYFDRNDDGILDDGEATYILAEGILARADPILRQRDYHFRGAVAQDGSIVTRADRNLTGPVEAGDSWTAHIVLSMRFEPVNTRPEFSLRSMPKAFHYEHRVLFEAPQGWHVNGTAGIPSPRIDGPRVAFIDPPAGPWDGTIYLEPPAGRGLVPVPALPWYVLLAILCCGSALIKRRT